MVDLPKVPNQLATTEAAVPPVSPGDLSAPYANLGRALDNLGGALEDTSVRLGEEAGRRAVTTDENGDLIAEARVGKHRKPQQIRAEDRIHFTMSGSEYFADRVYPEVLRVLGIAHDDAKAPALTAD